MRYVLFCAMNDALCVRCARNFVVSDPERCVTTMWFCLPGQVVVLAGPRCILPKRSHCHHLIGNAFGDPARVRARRASPFQPADPCLGRQQAAFLAEKVKPVVKAPQESSHRRRTCHRQLHSKDNYGTPA